MALKGVAGPCEVNAVGVEILVAQPFVRAAGSACYFIEVVAWNPLGTGKSLDYVAQTLYILVDTE